MSAGTYHSPITIESFEAKTQRRRPLTIKIADSLNNFFGSIGFLIINIAVFTVWITINTGLFPLIPIFDPFPFVLLTTGVSLEAIILTTIVLMSQNRQSYINTLRDELQLQLMLIDEKEATKTLYLLQQLLKKHGVKINDAELRHMLEETNTQYIENRLTQQLQSQHSNQFEKTLKQTLKNTSQALRH